MDCLLGREGSTQTCTWELERKLTHLILMIVMMIQRERERVGDGGDDDGAKRR